MIQRKLHSQPAPPLLQAEDHPDIQFWTERKWKKWNESAEGQFSKQKDKFHNTRYLEDVKGVRLDSTHISNILNCLRDIWHGFRIQNHIDANTIWTTMSLPLKRILCTEMVKSHPETNLGEDGWKINKLSRDHYPSFKQMWFTNKMEEKPDIRESSELVAKCARHKSPLARLTSSSLPSDAVTIQSPIMGKDSVNSKSSGDVLEDIAITAAASDSIASSPEIGTELTVLDSDTRASESPLPTSDINDAASTGSESELRCLATVASVTVHVPASAIEQVQQSRLHIRLCNPLLQVSKPRVTTTASESPLQVTSIASSLQATATISSSLQVTTVLSSLQATTISSSSQATTDVIFPAQVAAITSSELLQVTPTVTSLQVTAVPPVSQAASIASAAQVPALQSESTTVLSPSTTTSEKKASSWCPPLNKTDRTLCAHCWLKQVKPNGSKQEFDAYYQGLPVEIKSKYKDEADKPVASEIWTNGMANVITKIAVLPIY
ncbi:hypothetical protein V8E55_006534 [Tylopilus felleus]